MKFFSSRSRGDILSGTVIVTVGLFIASIFSYGLQVALGRLLTVADYGIFNALLSFSVVIAVFGNTLTTALIKLVSEYKAKDRFETLTHLFKHLSFTICGLGLFVGSLIFLSAFAISGFLKIENSQVYAFAIYIALLFLGIVPSAYLQGLLRFKAFAFWSIVSAFLRMFISVGFVLLGFAVQGVYWGMGISYALAFFLGIFLLQKNFTKPVRFNLKKEYKKVLSFAGVVLFIQIGMTILNNVDVILVKHYFTEDIAGLYSGLVTIGKVFLFGAGTVGVVMFPQVSAAFVNDKNYLGKFKQFSFIQLFLVVGGLLVFNLVPKTITSVMFGSRFIPSATYLPAFSFFVGLYVLINFMILFFLAVNETRVVWFLIPGVIMQVVLLGVFHTTLKAIICVNTSISFLILAGLLLYFVRYLNTRTRLETLNTSS